MSKQNLTSEQIIENILRPNNKNTNTSKQSKIAQETKEEIQRASDLQRRKPVKLSKPQSVTIILDGETFAKLQGHIMERKMQGDRSFSISKLGRQLIEDWVEENIKDE